MTKELVPLDIFVDHVILACQG